VTLNKLCSLTKELKNRKISIEYMAMSKFPDKVNENDIEFLSKNGLKSLSFGMESAVDRVLKLMDKNISRSKIKKTLLVLEKHKILAHLMFFVGFPGETRLEAHKTFRFIYRNKELIDLIGFDSFSLVYKSHVYNNPRKYGVTKILKQKNILIDS